jgi:PEP-CTERM motif
MTLNHATSFQTLCARTTLALALLAGTQLAAMAQTTVNVVPSQQHTPEFQFDLQTDNGSGRNALLVLWSASSQITFNRAPFGDPGVSTSPSNLGGAVSGFEVLKIQTAGADGMEVTESFTTRNGKTFRSGIQTAGGVDSLDVVTKGPDAGIFQSVNLSGGFTLTAVQSYKATGGHVEISRIRVNVPTGEVIADLNGTRDPTEDFNSGDPLPAVNFSSPDTVLWTFNPVTDVVGPKKFDIDAFLASDSTAAMATYGYQVLPGPNSFGGLGDEIYVAPLTVKNLSMTAQGMQFLANSWGFTPSPFSGQDQLDYINNSSGKWGSISSSLGFHSMLPEPSTYAFMGLGLVGVVLAARRQTNARQAT